MILRLAFCQHHHYSCWLTRQRTISLSPLHSKSPPTRVPIVCTICGFSPRLSARSSSSYYT